MNLCAKTAEVEFSREKVVANSPKKCFTNEERDSKIHECFQNRDACKESLGWTSKRSLRSASCCFSEQIQMNNPKSIRSFLSVDEPEELLDIRVPRAESDNERNRQHVPPWATYLEVSVLREALGVVDFGSSNGWPSFFQSIRNVCKTITSAEICNLFLVNSEENSLVTLLENNQELRIELTMELKAVRIDADYPVRMNHPPLDPDIAQEFISSLSLPVLDGCGKCLGILELVNKTDKKGEFTSEDEKILGAVADISALAIANVLYAENNQLAMNRMQGMLQTSQALLAVEGIRSLFHLVQHEVKDELGFEAVKLFIFDDQSRKLRGRHLPSMEVDLVAEEQSLVMETFRTGQMRLVTDIRKEPKFHPFVDQPVELSSDITSLALLPIKASVWDKNPCGVILVCNKRKGWVPFLKAPMIGDEDMPMLEALASYVGNALGSLHMMESVMHLHGEVEVYGVHRGFKNATSNSEDVNSSSSASLGSGFSSSAELDTSNDNSPTKSKRHSLDSRLEDTAPFGLTVDTNNDCPEDDDSVSMKHFSSNLTRRLGSTFTNLEDSPFEDNHSFADFLESSSSASSSVSPPRKSERSQSEDFLTQARSFRTGGRTNWDDVYLKTSGLDNFDERAPGFDGILSTDDSNTEANDDLPIPIDAMWSFTKPPRRLHRKKKLYGIRNAKLNKVALSRALAKDRSLWLVELLDPNVNMLEFSIQQLEQIVFAMFEAYDMCDGFDIPKKVLMSFIKAVSVRYRDNPFHNFNHAVTVMHTVFVTISVAEDINALLSQMDILALFIAALAHDIDHPGLNNSFQNQSLSSAALLYNDKSVLEQQSSTTLFSILSEAKNNILASFSHEEFVRIRQLIVGAVLETDLSMHSLLFNRFTNRLQNPFDRNSMDDRKIVCSIFLHAADLSNPTRQFGQARQWSELLVNEMQAQAVLEAKLGLPIAPFMQDLDNAVVVAKNEVHFISTFAQPLWEAMAILVPCTQYRVTNMQCNLEKYRQIIANGGEIV